MAGIRGHFRLFQEEKKGSDTNQQWINATSPALWVLTSRNVNHRRWLILYHWSINVAESGRNKSRVMKEISRKSLPTPLFLCGLVFVLRNVSQKGNEIAATIQCKVHVTPVLTFGALTD